MPDFIDKDAFLKDVLPECEYPVKLMAVVERQPIVHIDDMTFKIQNELQAAKPSRIVEITFVRHGRWECDRNGIVLCSVCQYPKQIGAHNFCGKCGADMREVSAQHSDHVSDDGCADHVEKNCENCARETCAVMPPIGKCYCDFWQPVLEPPESEVQDDEA